MAHITVYGSTWTEKERKIVISSLQRVERRINTCVHVIRCTLDV